MTDFQPPSVFGGGSGSNGQSSSAMSSTSTASKAKVSESPAVKNDDHAMTEIKTHNQYKTQGLDESSLDRSAMSQFQTWFQDAINHPDIPEPENMTVSTVAIDHKDGERASPPRPSSRVVLLKRVDEKGFYFYSNYDSRKGKEIAANPWIALNFYWYPLHRSVRVCGKVERLSREENQRYFDSRPVGSRIGALSSPQSQVIQSREELENIVRKNEKLYDAVGPAGLDGIEPPELAEKAIPVPEYWGGFRIIPDEVEFWMGRSNRLHDRFRYTRPVDSEKDEWKIDRLAP